MRQFKKWAPLIILIAVIIATFSVIYNDYAAYNRTLAADSDVTLNEYALNKAQQFKDQALQFTKENVVVAATGFFFVYAFTTAMSLPAATVLTLIGGFLFGKWLGTVIVVLGATAGSMILFFIAKTSLGDTLRAKAGKWYGKVEGNMRENAVGYLLFMRLVPIFPFVVVNILPALFNVPWRVHFLTTLFGIIPGAFVYVNLGEELGDIKSVNDLVSPDTLIAFALLGFFALIPTIYRQFKKTKIGENVGHDASAGTQAAPSRDNDISN